MKSELSKLHTSTSDARGETVTRHLRKQIVDKTAAFLAAGGKVKVAKPNNWQPQLNLAAGDIDSHKSRGGKA